MTITLTDERQAAAEKVAAAAGFETVQEYLDWLFMPDDERKRRIVEIQTMIAEAEEDFAHGRVHVLDDAEVERLIAEGKARRAARG